MEAPKDFLSKESFNKLPLLALLTWIFMFLIDALFFRKVVNPVDRHINFLITGISVAVILAFVRVFSLPKRDGWDYGLIVLNAIIILFSAAGFQGGTKELAQLGYADKADSASKQNDKKHTSYLSEGRPRVLLAALTDFSVFANQTSYFPDFELIAENEELKSENGMMKNSLGGKDKDILARIAELEKENAQLHTEVSGLMEDNTKLKAEATNKTDCPPINNDDKVALDNCNRKYDDLIARIGELNSTVIRINEIRNNSCIGAYDARYVEILGSFCRNQNQNVDIKEYLKYIQSLRPISIP